MQFRFLIVFLMFGLLGCATSAPAPNFYNGNYYMAGDAQCTRLAGVSRTRVACANASGQVTGYRDAMTPQQIQMYQFQMMQQQMEMQAIQQQIAANNAAMGANTQAMLGRSSMWSPPPVAPVMMPGGNQVRCIGVGIYANCRY